jgi:NADPH:quinone reductase-like Zn-dependent oxidoreductase
MPDSVLSNQSVSKESPGVGVSEMAALRARRQGGPEVLVVERPPMPVPDADEVLVEVHAAAITFDELKWPQTWTRDGVSRTPVIVSHEVSGVVSDVGRAVSDFKCGDEVCGLIGFDRDGAAADFVAVPAADLAIKPSKLSHAVAAVLPLAGLTALQALVDQAAVQPGEAVLVHGGAGGVGALTVQLAVIWGAHVSATVRSDAGELLAGFGVERVIDVRTEAFDASGRAYDVVIDTVGGETLDRSFSVLRRGGRLVTIAGAPPEGKADEYDVTAKFFLVTSNREQLTKLAALADSGRLHVEIADTFPLEKGREAFESSQRPNRCPGKTVILVRD